MPILVIVKLTSAKKCWKNCSFLPLSFWVYLTVILPASLSLCLSHCLLLSVFLTPSLSTWPYYCLYPSFLLSVLLTSTQYPYLGLFILTFLTLSFSLPLQVFQSVSHCQSPVLSLYHFGFLSTCIDHSISYCLSLCLSHFLSICLPLCSSFWLIQVVFFDSIFFIPFLFLLSIPPSFLFLRATDRCHQKLRWLSWMALLASMDNFDLESKNNRFVKVQSSARIWHSSAWLKFASDSTKVFWDSVVA